jgi:DNA transposition AAA+ family ATPase
MRAKFSITSNVRNFLSGLEAVERRGAEEACLMVVDGLPGLGKTRTLKWWAAQNGAIYIAAEFKWTPAWMLRDLLRRLDSRIKPARSVETLLAQTVDALGKRSLEMQTQGHEFGVVIDEAEPVARNEEMIETVRRGLSDKLEIPFILAGMGEIRSDLTRFSQAASRVSQYVEFAPATQEDVVQLVNDLCETTVKDDLVMFLHKASNGFVREVKEGIMSIERFNQKNPGPVGMAEMEGQPLMNDRKTGKPILVRE